MRPGRLHAIRSTATGQRPAPDPARRTASRAHWLVRMALLAVLLAAWAGFAAAASALATPGYAQAEVIIHGHTIRVDLADTEAKQELGLGNRTHLAPDRGMLFPYAEEGHPAFWMKRMHFPIDMIWLDNDTVVHIAANVPPPAPGTPDRELPVYRPKALANFVLELAAGRAHALGLHVGDQVSYRFDVR